MITLSLLQYLADNGYGEIDADLFWQKLSLGRIGVYITDIGQPQTRGQLRVQRYQLYSRGKNDVDGYTRLMKIVDFLNSSYATCTLPKAGFFQLNKSKLNSGKLAPENADIFADTKEYKNVSIMPVSTPTNIGEDTNGRIIWSVTGELRY